MKSMHSGETLLKDSSSKSYLAIVTLAIVSMSVSPINGERPEILPRKTIHSQKRCGAVRLWEFPNTIVWNTSRPRVMMRMEVIMACHGTWWSRRWCSGQSGLSIGISTIWSLFVRLFVVRQLLLLLFQRKITFRGGGAGRGVFDVFPDILPWFVVHEYQPLDSQGRGCNYVVGCYNRCSWSQSFCLVIAAIVVKSFLVIAKCNENWRVFVFVVVVVLAIHRCSTFKWKEQKKNTRRCR